MEHQKNIYIKQLGELMGEDEMKPKIEHEYHVSSYNLQQVEKVARSGLIKGSLGGLLFGTVTSALLSRYGTRFCFRYNYKIYTSTL